MRHARTFRGAGAVAVVAGALLLGGCGIQETEVIGAGSPATVEAFGGRDRLLFFRSPDGGLNPVMLVNESAIMIGPDYDESGTKGDVYSSGEDRPVPTDKLIMALLAGPREEDRAAGLTTSLPRPRRGGMAQVEVATGGQVTARVPIALGALDRTALRQLVCTIAYSQDSTGRSTVRLIGFDGVAQQDTCALDPA
ncbi:hypothetical protein ACIQ6Y_34850 [Streptomyces sp. NPDC096205]|uniref:hypothetical protein n=1 Tax=Streptomyces sp. NPDC096205 TaxID=3366081 RepID=UPI0038190774